MYSLSKEKKSKKEDQGLNLLTNWSNLQELHSIKNDHRKCIDQGS